MTHASGVTVSGSPSAEILLDETVAVWRRHWVSLAVLGAAAAPPAIAIALLAYPFFGTGVTDARDLVPLALVAAVGGIWYAIVDAATMIAARDARRGGAIDRARALRDAWSCGAGIVLTSVVKLSCMVVPAVAIAGAIALAAVALIGARATIPAVIVALPAGLFVAAYASCRLFALPATVLFDRLSSRAAISRALALSRGNAWRIALAYAPIGIAYWVLCGAAGVVLMLAIHSARVALAANAAVQVMLLPLLSVLATGLYDELRDAIAALDVSPRRSGG
ncbi:MAG: hypothetical protein ABJD07_15365 [Gemmatimonadaceae bacterium]